MKKLLCSSIFIFCSLFLVSTIFAQCQGNVYTTSLTWQTANSVQSFTSTELDYCAGIYYDPVVSNSPRITGRDGTDWARIHWGMDSAPAKLDFGYAAINNHRIPSGDHYLIAYYGCMSGLE